MNGNGSARECRESLGNGKARRWSAVMGKAADRIRLARRWLGSARKRMQRERRNGIDMHGMLRRERARHRCDRHGTAAAMTCMGWQSSAEDVVCADMVCLAREKRSGDLMSNEEGS